MGAIADAENLQTAAFQAALDEIFRRGSLSLEEKISGAEAHRPHRVNMLSVFTYYADFSVEIPEQPGNIVITDCTVENVDRFLHYNFSGNERWQAHRPLASVRFSGINATGIGLPQEQWVRFTEEKFVCKAI